MMKYKSHWVLLVSVMIIFITSAVCDAAVQTSDVISVGGGSTGSAHFLIEHTTGQSSAIGNSSTRSYLNFAGFWNAISGRPGVDFHASGSGDNYPEPGFRASLTLDVSTGSPDTGWFDYYYTKLRLNVESTNITSMLASEGSLNIEAVCTVNSAAGYTCNVKIIEGSPDSFDLTIYNPDGSVYFESGSAPLANGDFTIASSSSTQFQLTTYISPSLAGSIRPDCSGGCPYDPGTLVNLDAEDKAGYIFSSWTGCDSASGNICTMTMDANKDVTANFEECLQPIRIGDVYYQTIQAAYNAAADGDTIEIQLRSISEGLNFDRDISVSLWGGNSCNYTEVTGFTTLNGSMTIGRGSVITENIILE